MTNTVATMELGEDFPELRESIRRICENYPLDYWAKLDEKSGYPSEFVQELTDGGFLAALIPEEFGGAGLPLRAAAVILEEINACGCQASPAHAQMYIMGTLLRHGSEEQKRTYLPEIAAGRLRLQAFGVTEPTTGSDTTQLKTRAVRDGDHYVINGQKVWTSRALYSDLLLLLARTTPLDQVAKKTDGISVFLIDLREARGNGVDIRPINALINHNTTEVFIENLRVPASALIGEEGKGFRYILDGMNAERILVASECVGDGRYMVRRAVEYAKERRVFNREIGANQGVQFPIARAHAELEAADLMARKAAALFDAHQPCGGEANIAKLLASEATWKAADTALQTFGGFGYAVEYGIERKWRECRIYQTAPISTNMILAYVGQHMLGLPRSY
ncbi:MULTISPECIES: acyl-CoA dehydrogenase family protein [Brucella/Ochrobactrum group]|uniref:Acyl-CoA/acyl-ACP dehydrogenase n=2 Tax=Brucella/Ochrobactrum group TaxID=2826938 RepID=A0A849KXH8_9HYPH|nr:acyl-CoA/acyl-ACP dehydrogenase [Brucella anthropi]MPR63581.1 acyl-CoA dehydrogenase [Brucella intermedia]NNU62256.1 acyl-CoA/acyl-ACP dehydrogenase [[Ochrobactrum] soli]PJR88841.1 acyl-CoA dehydrogenase [Ochrobactrum sp. 721/2009]PJT16824.1 acyl-CoA dehydrogenase [Ochrobactrum sp. 720/2009]PJT26645.1 acyl-CoA dehydrogenase [Ochrobactrum sp. 715/2009]PJT28539.1 acyl-CoA dehydrogenase [Ochrobactrum sp. 695/2009]PJT36166.1 acyl-CoA dehydrogenase [Ochrobactrum sp. 689/2009]